MNKTQQHDLELVSGLELGYARLKQIMSDNKSGRYYLSNDELRDLPKLNLWETNFISSICNGFQFGDITSLSEKQKACAEKIYDKLSTIR